LVDREQFALDARRHVGRALRKIALALLKRKSSKAKLSVAQKRKRAGYLTDLLLVLGGASAAS
jgi:hypothetical protein